ncbi:MAG: hypothetical protein K6G29_03875 [Clostridiales bacterium]|nr:hypothetical protein [Clostridiales bacterium]
MTEKRKRFPAILFIAAFFFLCVFFSLGMLLPGAADAADSGDMPKLVSDGKISATWRDDFEGWFSKHFAYRDVLVDAFSVLKEKVFRTGNDQVLVGRDGFLFFRETLADYTGSDPMTDEELNAAADALKNLSDYAEEHGAAFVFLCAPNKNTIYPEKMPALPQQAADPDSSNLSRLLPLLDERGVNYADVRPLLIEAKDERLVYHKRDTHWNNEGARIAAKAVLDAAGIPLGIFDAPLTDVTHDFRGDLDSLLYPKTPRYDDEYVLNIGNRFRYVSGGSSLMNLDILTQYKSDKVLGIFSSLVFRDSFGSALIPYFASCSGSARFHRALPFRIDLLEDPETGETVGTDLVVVEIAERNLRNLIGSDARISG